MLFLVARRSSHDAMHGAGALVALAVMGCGSCGEAPQEAAPALRMNASWSASTATSHESPPAISLHKAVAPAPVDDWENLEIPTRVEGSCNLEATLLEAARAVVRENERGHWMSEPIPEPRAWLRRTLAALPSSADAQRIVGPTARRAVRAIDRRDFPALAALVDPNTGVCLRASFERSCRWMHADELAQCATDPNVESWSIDTGSDSPNATTMTCRAAFDDLFAVRPIERASVAYNCFPEDAGRSNSAGGHVDLEAEGDLYVEYHLSDPRGGHSWKSVWLTFQSTPRGPILRAIMSEYWGI